MGYIAVHIFYISYFRVEINKTWQLTKYGKVVREGMKSYMAKISDLCI